MMETFKEWLGRQEQQAALPKSEAFQHRVRHIARIMAEKGDPDAQKFCQTYFVSYCRRQNEHPVQEIQSKTSKTTAHRPEFITSRSLFEIGNRILSFMIRRTNSAAEYAALKQDRETEIKAKQNAEILRDMSEIMKRHY